MRPSLSGPLCGETAGTEDSPADIRYPRGPSQPLGRRRKTAPTVAIRVQLRTAGNAARRDVDGGHLAMEAPALVGAERSRARPYSRPSIVAGQVRT